MASQTGRTERKFSDAAWLTSGTLPKLLAVLDRDGEEARAVGGAVRNALLGAPVLEVDVATTAVPDEVVKRVTAAGFKAVPTGIDHGTVTVVIDKHPFEVTTLRKDVETDRWLYTEPDWDKLRAVVTGHGPASQDRIDCRRRSREHVDWVERMLLAEAA